MTFNENDIDLIERYLQGLTTEEEQSQIERRLNDDGRFSYETKLMAYFLHSINDIGLKSDNERINMIRKTSSSDTKRYVLSVAAMFIGILVFAAVISIPVYRTVIKPLIEKSQVSQPRQKPDNSIQMPDTLSADTIQADTIRHSDDGMPADTQVSKPESKEPAEPSVQVKQEIVDHPKQAESEQEPPKRDSVQHPDMKATPTATTPSVPKKVNKIVSYGTLQGYTFGPVKAVKNGNVVTCTFVMKCDNEDAEIQMHSARAKDNTGKTYNAADCLLNGKLTRIKEKWRAGENHSITIQIKNVSADVTALSTVSFSFQSKTKSLDQKSIPIVLKIENF